MENAEKTIVIIDDHYFDVTHYIHSHPSEKIIFKRFYLKDATDEYNSIKDNGDEYAIRLLDKYCIGHINDVNISEYIKK